MDVPKGRTTGTISLIVVAAAITAEGYPRVDDRQAVFVHIENYAAVPPEHIAHARQQLAHVYDAAGVRVESSAESGHGRCERQFTVHVAVLAGTSADRFVKAGNITRKVVAQASSDARRIYVLWERVGAAVDRHAVGRGDALGLVVAHELGHVLLPGRGHSRNGIMQAEYTVHLSYRLKFSAEEAWAMQRFIATQNAALRGNPHCQPIQASVKSGGSPQLLEPVHDQLHFVDDDVSRGGIVCADDAYEAPVGQHIERPSPGC